MQNQPPFGYVSYADVPREYRQLQHIPPPPPPFTTEADRTPVHQQIPTQHYGNIPPVDQTYGPVVNYPQNQVHAQQPNHNVRFAPPHPSQYWEPGFQQPYYYAPPRQNHPRVHAVTPPQHAVGYIKVVRAQTVNDRANLHSNQVNRVSLEENAMMFAEELNREQVSSKFGLTFLKYYDNVPPYDRIRVWKSKGGLTFYDCSCGKRKPSQGIKKMKEHTSRHQSEGFKCDKCSKIYESEIFLIAHKRVHEEYEQNREGQ
jgi:hypothetical protein